MDMSGSQRIETSREVLWEALNDPEILRQCIPGCQEIAKLSPTEMTAKVVLKIGPVKATFAGKVTLSDLDPPSGYTISGEGQGGVAGFARGSAKVRLTRTARRRRSSTTTSRRMSVARSPSSARGLSTAPPASLRASSSRSSARS